MITSGRFEWTVANKAEAERLRLHEAQFRSAFERAPIGIALIGLGEGHIAEILQINPALGALLGRDPADTQGMPYHELFADADREAVSRSLARLLAGEDVTGHEARVRHTDGLLTWVEVGASLVRDDASSTPFAVMQIRDLTRQRYAATLRATQYAVARSIAEATSLSLGLTEVVREVCEHLGWAGGQYWHVNSERDVIERLATWWAPEQVDTVAAKLATTTLSRHEGVAGNVWASGSTIWIGNIAGLSGPSDRARAAVASGLNAVIGLPIRSGEQAGVLLFLATEMAEPDSEMSSALDAICAHVARFVERCRAEEFRRLVESSPDAMMIADSNGRIVTLNSRTERMFGRSREELLGELVDVLVPGQFRPPTVAVDTQRVAAGVETRGRRKDGTEFSMEVIRSSVDADGESLVSLSIRDTTERRRAEDARLLLAAIVDSSEDAIVGCTVEGTITSWNRAAEAAFGYTEAEVLGAPLAILVFEADRESSNTMLERIGRGERVEHHDTVRRCRDGRRLDVSISMAGIRNAQGELVGASQVIHDITQRKQAVAALAAAKETAEVSSRAFEAFSYSVAHDLRAPLRAIDGFTGLLGEDYADIFDERAKTYLDRVVTAARQMGQLIDSLLDLARLAHRDLDSSTVDLSAMALEALAHLAEASPRRTVASVVQPGVSAVVDPVLFSAVIENLIGNAWKFTRDQPAARIEFGRDDVGFFVRDNGVGFDMAYYDRLFGVFQRLHDRAQFEGTGIGLSTVQRIVQRHGGRIWAESTVGHGATFYFTLDADDQSDIPTNLGSGTSTTPNAS